MKTLVLVSLFLQANAIWSQELRPYDAVWGLDSTYRIEVITEIAPLAATRKISIQNNQVVSSKKINKQKAYCLFENVRDDKPKFESIKKGQIFKLSNDFRLSWEQYFDYRIWQRFLFLGWGNGYYQSFFCHSGENGELDYQTVQSQVGKFLKIYRD